MIYSLFRDYFPIINQYATEKTIFIVGSMTVYLIFFVFYNLFFALLYKIPSFVEKYKVQKDKWPAESLVKKTIITLTISFAIGHPLM